MIKSMTTGKPITIIINFAIPMIIGNIFQQLYNLTDAAIVGKFIGSDALAAVGTTGTTSFLLISWLIGLTNGAGIIISQYFGANKFENMRRAFVSLMYVVSAMTVFISVIGGLGAKPALRLLNTPPEIIDGAASYLRIIFFGTIGVALYNTCAAVLRSVGDSRVPLYALIVSSIVNIGLDLLFVVNFHGGINSTAYATIIAQISSALVCIFFIMKKYAILHIRRNEWIFDKNMIVKILKMGIPNALQSSLISLSGMSVQRLVNSFGTTTIAAYTAGTKIDTLAIQPIVSIGTAMSVFTAQNIGAKNIDRIKSGVKQTLILMVSSCIVVAAVIVSFRVQLLHLFLDKNKDFEAIAIGGQYLSVIGIAYIIAGIMQTFLNLIKGAGDINIAMSIGLIELSARVAFSYVLAHFFGTWGIWTAVPAAWGMACIMTVLRYCSGHWKTKRIS
ncbi:MAG: MATE family efflux transporter [Clostridia bacterium]|nr:MATE family efflux transporter [Clostridia bacterium]